MSTINRLIIGKSTDAYLNLAVESYLVDTHIDGVTLYLWQNADTVVIGAHQNPYREVALDTLLMSGGRLARRRSGGGAVYHDLGNLNFSFVADGSEYSVIRQLYVVQRAVSRFGLATAQTGRNDLTIDGKKFSGNAFFNSKHARLHHGTLLIDTDSDRLSAVLRPSPQKLQKRGVGSVSARVVNLHDICPAITADSLSQQLRSVFFAEYPDAVEIDFDSIATLPEVRATAEHLASDEWLYADWREFRTTTTACFDWGIVELSLVRDSKQDRLVSIEIASDSLYPNVIDYLKTSLPYLPFSKYGMLVELMNWSEAERDMIQNVLDLVLSQ